MTGPPSSRVDLPSTPPPTVLAELRRALDIVARAAHLDVAGLASELYARWYARPQTGPPPTALPAGSVLERNLVDALRAADAATHRWQDGWRVQAISNRGRILVARGDEHQVLDRVDVVPDTRPCLPPAVGVPVRVVTRRELVAPDAGSWLTVGGGWDPTGLPERCVRVYWNVALTHAPALVHHLTSQLLDAGITYGLKLPTSPESYARADTAVLYLPDQPATAAGPIRRAHHQLRDGLRAATPPLTLPLGRGLALAEDPGTGESFGEHRCRLIARAAHASVREHPLDPQATLDAVLRRLARDGIDPARPHLHADSDADHRVFILDDDA